MSISNKAKKLKFIPNYKSCLEFQIQLKLKHWSEFKLAHVNNKNNRNSHNLGCLPRNCAEHHEYIVTAWLFQHQEENVAGAYSVSKPADHREHHCSQPNSHNLYLVRKPTSRTRSYHLFGFLFSCNAAAQKMLTWVHTPDWLANGICQL